MIRQRLMAGVVRVRCWGPQVRLPDPSGAPAEGVPRQPSGATRPGGQGGAALRPMGEEADRQAVITAACTCRTVSEATYRSHSPADGRSLCVLALATTGGGGGVRPPRLRPAPTALLPGTTCHRPVKRRPRWPRWLTGRLSVWALAAVRGRGARPRGGPELLPALLPPAGLPRAGRLLRHRALRRHPRPRSRRLARHGHQRTLQVTAAVPPV